MNIEGVPDGIKKAILGLIFSIPITIWGGILYFGKKESIALSGFLLTFSITGLLLIPVMGFLLDKSLEGRIKERSLRYLVIAAIISLLIGLAVRYFKDLFLTATSLWPYNAN